jgi:hypothetical protein
VRLEVQPEYSAGISGGHMRWDLETGDFGGEDILQPPTLQLSARTPLPYLHSLLPGLAQPAEVLDRTLISNPDFPAWLHFTAFEDPFLDLHPL